MGNVFEKRGVRLIIAAGICLLLALPARGALGAVDLTGEYRADETGIMNMADLCTVSATQTGTSLSFVQTCTVGPYTFTGTVSGTIDASTGAFSVSGECDFSGVLEPYTLTGIGSSDSLSFSADGFCGAMEARWFATKCGNGIADALEACEDGNRDDGDCCSATCQLDPAGQVCDGPTTACTFSACDGAGSCVPGSPNPAGSVCDLDADLCTADECDGAGTCQALGQPLACDACSSCDPAFGCVGDVKPRAPFGHDPEPGECFREHIQRSRLVAKRAKVTPRDRLKWIWSKGFPVDPASFGDPINATSYRLCGFHRASADDPYRTFAVVELPPGSDWTTSNGGFTLKRKTANGAARVVLRGSDVINKPRIRLTIKGEIAGLEPAFDVGADRVVVQLSADNGRCWTSDLWGSATDKLIRARQ